MSLFSRWRKRNQSPVSTGEPTGINQASNKAATITHFKQFAESRIGVEAYVEPATHVTQTTLLLIATDGEWTRRKVPNNQAAYDLAKKLALPIYDVQLTGYPPRMREWNAKRQRELKNKD